MEPTTKAHTDQCWRLRKCISGQVFSPLSEMGCLKAPLHISSSPTAQLCKDKLASLEVTSQLTLKRRNFSVLAVTLCLSFVSLFPVFSLSGPAGPSVIPSPPPAAGTSPRTARSHPAPRLPWNSLCRAGWAPPTQPQIEELNHLKLKLHLKNYLGDIWQIDHEQGLSRWLQSCEQCQIHSGRGSSLAFNLKIHLCLFSDRETLKEPPVESLFSKSQSWWKLAWPKVTPGEV